VSFFGMLGRQLADDIRRLPQTTRERLSEAGRAQRAINIADLRTLARRRLPAGVFDYVDGAAWDEATKRHNESDLQALMLRPRMLVGATEIDLSTEVLGRRLEVPLLGAPTGLTGLVHHEGEVGIAQAVHGAGGVYVLSSAASRTLEDVAAASPGPRWFQLYVGHDRGLAQALLERASATGYEAVVVTVDAARAGARERDQRNGFVVPPRITARTLVDGVRRPRWTANFLSRPRLLSESLLLSMAQEGQAASMAELIGRQLDPALSWRDIAWVQEHWDGPLLIKGILRGDDARQAASLGVAGVIVSNHGGRQLDHATSTIRALPEIVDAAGGELEVLMDGGIRRGVDIIRALALGARGVLAGRALVYGLAAGGPAGAARAVEILVDELRLAMTLLGCPSVRELDPPWVTGLTLPLSIFRDVG
jgi:isopentenyl diphosphate isomerase/L-lactate dehydrogenase-like FMN-dependent dehydrogenase